MEMMNYEEICKRFKAEKKVWYIHKGSAIPKKIKCIFLKDNEGCGDYVCVRLDNDKEFFNNEIFETAGDALRKITPKTQDCIICKKPTEIFTPTSGISHVRCTYNFRHIRGTDMPTPQAAVYEYNMLRRLEPDNICNSDCSYCLNGSCNERRSKNTGNSVPSL